MTEGIIDKIFVSFIEHNKYKSWLTLEALRAFRELNTELKQELDVYCKDREKYNTGLHRYLFGDSE